MQFEDPVQCNVYSDYYKVHSVTGMGVPEHPLIPLSRRTEESFKTDRKSHFTECDNILSALHFSCQHN